MLGLRMLLDLLQRSHDVLAGKQTWHLSAIGGCWAAALQPEKVMLQHADPFVAGNTAVVKIRNLSHGSFS